jgi:hypothetical protein
MMVGQHRTPFHPVQLVNEQGHTRIVACRECQNQPYQVQAQGQILSFHQDYTTALTARDSELARLAARRSA